VRPALVISYGNPLRGDDAVGHEVGDALWVERELRPELDGAAFCWAHELTPEMALNISGAGVVVFLDAAADGCQAGTVGVRAVHAPGARASVPAGCWQDLSPSALMGLARELYGSEPPAVLVTVSVGSARIGEGLSAPVRAAVPRAAEAGREAIISLQKQVQGQSDRPGAVAPAREEATNHA